MTRFIAGIAVTIAVHLLGWPRIEATLRTVGDGAKRAYVAAEHEIRATEAGK